MIVFRVCREPHRALDGEGARINGGRWNSPGVPMVYGAEHPALAILEILVHLDLSIDLVPDDYVVLRIEIPDDELAIEDSEPSPEMSAIGDRWVRSRRSLALRVRSAVAPLSHNILLNPLHPAIAAVAVAAPTP